MGYVSTWMGDHLSALLESLMVLQLALVDQNPLWPGFIIFFLKTNIILLQTALLKLN